MVAADVLDVGDLTSEGCAADVVIKVLVVGVGVVPVLVLAVAVPGAIAIPAAL